MTQRTIDARAEAKIYKALYHGSSDQTISALAGISPRHLEAIRKTTRMVLAANDGVVEDFLEIVDRFASGSEQRVFFPLGSTDPKTDDLYARRADSGQVAEGLTNLPKRKREALEAIEQDWSAEEMRDLGGALLRLADAIDQDWDPQNLQAEFHWPSAAAKIERNAVELAKRAKLLLRQKEVRDKFVPAELLGEPAWLMLLELFCQFAGSAKVSTKSLTLASGCSETTALRYIDRMEAHDLVARSTSPNDRRVTLIALTKQGVLSVGRVLERT